MIEKLKDIFYDLNDLLVTLIIILVIVLAIAYVFTNAFDLDLNRASVFDFFGDSPEDPTPPPAGTTEPEPETTETQTPTDPPTPTEGGIINVDPETDETTAPAQTPTEPAGQSAIVTMPTGGNLTDFALEMQEKGIIKDYESFINMVSSQGLDTQVQAGDYEFPLDITDAEAVRIMFGM